RLATTPMLDAATLALAEDAVTALELGRRGPTDVLSIVVSEVDDIGHGYGPRSQEQLDNLLRLDRELGGFLAFLDHTVGAGRYVVALSADTTRLRTFPSTGGRRESQAGGSPRLRSTPF